MTLFKQGIWSLLLFFLCVEIGCLLLLPFGPPFRQSSLPFRQWLLPLVFVWWGIMTPVLSYLLFQRFVSCWQSRPVSHPVRTEGHVPVALHLSLADLEIRRRRSRDREQRKHYQTLALALRGYSIEKIVALMRMDEESITALIFSYNTWGPQVLRTRSKRFLQPIAQLLRNGADRQMALRTSTGAYRSGRAGKVNGRSAFQATG